MSQTAKAKIEGIQVTGQFWEEDPPESIVEDLDALLGPFEVFVYEDSSCEDAGYYGIILSEEELSDDQVIKASRRLFPNVHDDNEDEDEEEGEINWDNEGSAWGDDD